jgi:hypothetical protein
MSNRKPENRRIQTVKVTLWALPADAPAVIHDEKREHVQQRKLDSAEQHQMRGRLKMFFNAWWSDTTGWVLLSVANARRW